MTPHIGLKVDICALLLKKVVVVVVENAYIKIAREMVSRSIKKISKINICMYISYPNPKFQKLFKNIVALSIDCRNKY